MKPLSQALAELGLAGRLEILPVQSGYPSPKQVNLVLLRRDGATLLFESSAATDEIVRDVHAGLDAHAVGRLDALLVTHCHGDHAGSAGIIAGRGRTGGDRAPIYLHSSGYRFLTHPSAAFLQETYDIFLTRAQWGLLAYDALSEEDMIEHALRKRFARYFSRTPRSALRFVDKGQLPDSIIAIPTPGHSGDCVLYYDEELRVAVPGDTIICTGAVDKPETHSYVIPIFTVTGQMYSMAWENYLETIRVLRRFFSTHEVRAVLPPHGKFAVTEPLEWVAFAERYFEGIYRALLEGFLGDPARRSTPFRACDLTPHIPNAGAHPISTPSHVFGMLCALADEGFLDLSEDAHTRQITFRVLATPPKDYVTRRLAEEPGPVTVYRKLAR